MSLLNLIMGKTQSIKEIDNDNQRYGQRYTSDPKIISMRKLRNKQLDELEKERLRKAILEHDIKRQKMMMHGNTGMVKTASPQVKPQKWFDRHKI